MDAQFILTFNVPRLLYCWINTFTPITIRGSPIITSG